MESAWKYRFHLVIAAEDQAEANIVAALVDPDLEGRRSFMLPLSRDGQGPATHFAALSLATEAMLATMEKALVAGALPSLRFWRMDAESEALQATSSPTARISLGEAWDWADTLVDCDLEPLLQLVILEGE